ncbi:MAG: hypothetical protein ACO3XO_10560, partial [Bdellovibrionota bacterium]
MEPHKDTTLTKLSLSSALLPLLSACISPKPLPDSSLEGYSLSPVPIESSSSPQTHIGRLFEANIEGIPATLEAQCQRLGMKLCLSHNETFRFLWNYCQHSFEKTGFMIGESSVGNFHLTLIDDKATNTNHGEEAPIRQGSVQGSIKGKDGRTFQVSGEFRVKEFDTFHQLTFQLDNPMLGALDAQLSQSKNPFQENHLRMRVEATPLAQLLGAQSFDTRIHLPIGFSAGGTFHFAFRKSHLHRMLTQAAQHEEFGKREAESLATMFVGYTPLSFTAFERNDSTVSHDKKRGEPYLPLLEEALRRIPQNSFVGLKLHHP